VLQGFLFARIAENYTVDSPTASESANWQDNSGFWRGGEKAYTDYRDGNVDGADCRLVGDDSQVRPRCLCNDRSGESKRNSHLSVKLYRCLPAIHVI
jgi:hypothetical protein